MLCTGLNSILALTLAVMWLPTGCGIFWPGRNSIEIRSAHDPSLCWDIPGGLNQPGAPIQWYPCHGGPNQAFEIEEWTLWWGGHVMNIFHKSSGLCVTAPRMMGNQLELDACGGGQNFRFQRQIFDVPSLICAYCNATQKNIYLQAWSGSEVDEDLCVGADFNGQGAMLGVQVCDYFDFIQNFPSLPQVDLQWIQLDVCRTYHPLVKYEDFCSNCKCDAFEGNCKNSGECQSGLACKFSAEAGINLCCPLFTSYQSGFCTKQCPCGANEGECTIDEECALGFECKLDSSTNERRCQLSGVGGGCPEGQICCGVPINGECSSYCVENPNADCP